MTIFSGLDLVKAYFQCPISEESSYKTTTLTNWGTWRYLWMTMGLKNSAQTFQRLMSHVLDGIYNCFVYFDDILCFSNNESEHQELVRKLIEVSNAGLALSLKKCIFSRPGLFGLSHSADHAVWKGYFFRISMPSVIGLQMSKNQMPLTRGSLVLNLCKNSFFNPLAFIVLALWPSKLAK